MLLSFSVVWDYYNLWNHHFVQIYHSLFKKTVRKTLEFMRKRNKYFICSCFIEVDILVVKVMQNLCWLQREGEDTFRSECNLKQNTRSKINHVKETVIFRSSVSSVSFWFLRPEVNLPFDLEVGQEIRGVRVLFSPALAMGTAVQCLDLAEITLSAVWRQPEPQKTTHLKKKKDLEDVGND